MATNDGGPAFPAAREHGSEPGMSLRDYFAAKAMTGWLGSYGPNNALDDVVRYGDFLADRFYLLADAMLAARSKPKP